jgi:hypothetical protein
MNLPSLPQDKANHAVYGAVIAAIVSLHSIQLALIVVICVGVGKELSDWWQNRHGGHHGVEALDVVATVFGGLIVLAPQLVKELL